MKNTLRLVSLLSAFAISVSPVFAAPGGGDPRPPRPNISMAPGGGDPRPPRPDVDIIVRTNANFDLAVAASGQFVRI